MFGPCYCRLPHTSQNSDLKQHAPLSVLFRLRCHCQPSTLTQVSRLKTTGVLEGGRRRGGEDWNTFSHSPKPGAPRLWAAGLELRGGGDTTCSWGACETPGPGRRGALWAGAPVGSDSLKCFTVQIWRGRWLVSRTKGPEKLKHSEGIACRLGFSEGCSRLLIHIENDIEKMPPVEALVDILPMTECEDSVFLRHILLVSVPSLNGNKGNPLHGC